MRIVFVEPAGRMLGGAERSLSALSCGLVARGHRVMVVTRPDADAVEMFEAAGTEVEFAASLADIAGGTRHGAAGKFVLQAATAAPRVWRAASDIAKLAKRFQADVVHSNGFRAHVIAPALRSHRLRLSWSLRDFAPHPMQRKILQVASNAVDLVLANSQFTAQQIPARHRRVRVVGNPIVLRQLPNRGDARRQLELDEHAKIVAVLGHLHPSKGQHIAVEAIRALRTDSKYSDAMLLVVGAAAYGDESQRYESELRQQGCVGVRFLGGVLDVESVYAAADLVVQPSIHPEGFGRTVVEAQMAGVPVVATAIGGACELIEHNSNGLLVAPDDPQELAHAMARILGDADLHKNLVASGSISGNRFTACAHVDAVEKALRELENL